MKPGTDARLFLAGNDTGEVLQVGSIMGTGGRQDAVMACWCGFCS